MRDPGSDPRSFDLLQRWFQEVITHAGGTEEGVLATGAQELIPLLPAEIEGVIQPSTRQSALERLSIYSNAYYARLLECMGDCFPVLKQTLGDEVFDSFALEYLQKYPSRSYTLDLLGEHFCAFLAETRPEPEDNSGDTGWPDFLIDLATLEWTIGRVFDGPGVEGQELLTLETLQSFPAARFADAQLAPVEGLRLLTFRYPVSAYYTVVRRAGEKESIPIPDPAIERLAVFRRDFVVRRYALTSTQFALLQQLQLGSTVAEAIAVAAMTDLDEDSLARALQSWFRFWSAEGFFAKLTLQA